MAVRVRVPLAALAKGKKEFSGLIKPAYSFTLT